MNRNIYIFVYNQCTAVSVRNIKNQGCSSDYLSKKNVEVIVSHFSCKGLNQYNEDEFSMSIAFWKLGTVHSVNTDFT